MTLAICVFDWSGEKGDIYRMIAENCGSWWYRKMFKSFQHIVLCQSRNGTLLNIQGLLRFKFHLEWMTSLMLYVPSFCVSTLQSTQFMSIPFRDRSDRSDRSDRGDVSDLSERLGHRSHRSVLAFLFTLQSSLPSVAPESYDLLCFICCLKWRKLTKIWPI